MRRYEFVLAALLAGCAGVPREGDQEQVVLPQRVVDPFTRMTLQYSGVSDFNRFAQERLSPLEARLQREFGSRDAVGKLRGLHGFLWDINLQRFARNLQPEQAYDLTRLDNILAADLSGVSDRPVGSSPGLAAEYIILARSLGVSVFPVLVQGVQGWRVDCAYADNGVVQINPTRHDGISLRTTVEGRRLSDQEFLGVFVGMKGQQLYAQGRLSEAADAFNIAYVLFPNERFAVFAGTCHERMNDHLRAIGWFQDALDKNPNDGEALMHMGNVFVRMNQWQEASRWYVRAAERLPDLAPLQAATGSCFLRLNNPRAALPYLRRACELVPGEEIYQQLKSDAEARLGMLREY
ncbi:tetratricopeptide repeat protein [Candidatus Woesearchaeota archaeon]|nr:tetratricopeptide repeat protein [Candidatus Woesearchaeota archaeon]